ncbi:hypothetical protein [Nonomuraea typhae]|uniref:hypothetical protein n=1 Tax=Nonomuraea typhae TaxID=2603600 RepID=UPI0012FAFF54|nr:hypothetical protein [Nonomuraea typhae]
MKRPRWLRRSIGAAVLGVAMAASLLSPAAAAAATAPLPYAPDLPNLSTPQIAYDVSFQPVAKGVAVRGADGSLLYGVRSGNGFAPLQSLGGTIVGDPSVVVTSNGTHFFVRGTDDQVYTTTITPSGAQTGFSHVPGLTVTGEIESIVARGEPSANIRIFARGTDGAVWTNVLRNGAWIGWSSLGGFATSEITTGRVFIPANQIRVYIRGADHRVYLNQVTPTGASGFQPVGDLRVTSNIALADDMFFNGMEIYARGEDNQLWTLLTTNGTWRPLGGSLTSDPAVSSQANLVAVYARGTDNTLSINKRISAGFLGFTRIEGQVTSNPTALSPNGFEGRQAQVLLARLPGGALATNFAGTNSIGLLDSFTGYVPVPGPAVD